jgi:DNA repair protein SbcD/Mre11
LQSQATPVRVAQCPVVELQLTGTLAFERADLDNSQIEKMVVAAFQPLHCLLKDVTLANEFEIQVSETLTRAEVELHVLRELVERDVRRRAQSEAWAKMILDLKSLALEDSPSTEVVAALRAFRATLGEEDAPC